VTRRVALTPPLVMIVTRVLIVPRYTLHISSGKTARR
jgi:hypothetical protein